MPETPGRYDHYDHYDIFGDDPVVKCRRCGSSAPIDTLADAVAWADAHEPVNARPWFMTKGEAVYRALAPYVDDTERHDATRAATQALDLDDPAKPAVWSDRPDINWCVRCDAWHRTDHDHDWRPQDAAR